MSRLRVSGIAAATFTLAVFLTGSPLTDQPAAAATTTAATGAAAARPAVPGEPPSITCADAPTADVGPDTARGAAIVAA